MASGSPLRAIAFTSLSALLVLHTENQSSLVDNSTAKESAPVRQLSPLEPKALMESSTPFELVDVRTA